MFDLLLRPPKDRLLQRPAQALAPRCRPAWLTALGGVASLAAAGLAWAELPWAAVVSWLLGRTFDGLDGPVARLRGESSDFGGYADLLTDTLGYALVPLGVAMAIDTRTTWIMVALLLGSFYMNTVSWLYLAALLEKRGRGAQANGESTSVVMPSALIEGTETIVFFAVFLAFPAQARWIFPLMAGLVMVGVVQRLLWARRLT